MPAAGLPRQSNAVVKMTERSFPIDTTSIPKNILPKKDAGTRGNVVGARCLSVLGGKIRVG
jgi:hypothetical protein